MARRYCLIILFITSLFDFSSTGIASADSLDNLRASDSKSKGGRCDNEFVWVGSLNPRSGQGHEIPLYFPLHSPVAVTPGDTVRVRFQMWPGDAMPRVYYRVTKGTAYQPGKPWSATPIVPAKISVQGGVDPNNEAFEAVIPAIGSNEVSRVDFYIEATREVGGVVHRCEVIENPFDYDDNAQHHIHSYIASPKEPSRTYQLLVRNFGARYNPSRRGQPGVQYDYSGTFCDVTDEVIDSLKLMGFDTIWLSGIVDFDNSSGVRKGDAGSPYATRNFFRASADLACMAPGQHRFPQATSGDAPTLQATKEAMVLFERIHAKGLRVMIDLVPNHTARNYEQFPGKVFPWEPDPLPLDSHHYQYEYGQTGVKIIGNSRLVFGQGSNDWTDTYRLDYTNERTAAQLDDPVTTKKMAAGNSFNNSNPAAAPEHSMYQVLDRVVETWQSRGVDGFRVDFPHALNDDLWAYLAYNAKTRAEGHGRHGGMGSRYRATVMFIGEGYDLDGWYGPDSGAIGNAGSTWANMFAGGFDGIYDKNGLLDQVRNIYTQSWWANGIGQRVRAETNDPFEYSRTVGNVGKTGAQALVRMMSNHDELQPASNEWAGSSSDDMLKPRAATGAVVLLPGSSLLYNGQEIGEAAGIEDNYWCRPSPIPVLGVAALMATERRRFSTTSSCRHCGDGLIMLWIAAKRHCDDTTVGFLV